MKSPLSLPWPRRCSIGGRKRKEQMKKNKAALAIERERPPTATPLSDSRRVPPEAPPDCCSRSFSGPQMRKDASPRARTWLETPCR